MSLDVVIVDDDSVVLFLHKVLVKKTMEPNQVLEFDNATAALQFLCNRPNDSTPLLILLDINMPVLSGWDFLDTLQQHEPGSNLFVVMVTSSINFSDRKNSEKYPLVFDYLEKPLTREACCVLSNKIKQLL